MRILYVGGIYHCEYSLYRESLSNPELDVLFCPNILTVGNNLHKVVSDMDYLSQLNGAVKIFNRKDIDKIKSIFKPDLTIFRNFADTEYLIQDGELLWEQEINPKREDGTKVQERPLGPAKAIATQSPHKAKENGWHYFPYCVSKNCEHTLNMDRPIDIMLATKLPPATWGGNMKLKGMDILLQPLLNTDYNKRIYIIDLSDKLLPNYYLGHINGYIHPVKAIEELKRTKIYLSPSTVWYDPGYISHKTLQALACGCLVVTNRVEGIEDIFGPDGENLLYSSSQEETIDKVKFSLERESYRLQIIRRGEAFAHHQFNWHKYLLKMREVMA